MSANSILYTFSTTFRPVEKASRSFWSRVNLTRPRPCPAALAVSRSTRCDAQLAYQRRSALGFRVICGTRYGHGFLEQVIGIVLQ
jgi:hypothetical protein